MSQNDTESHRDDHHSRVDDDDTKQVRLDELFNPVDPDRCEAYADSTGERCRQAAMTPFPYCADHQHLLDEVDLERMGLKPSVLGV